MIGLMVAISAKNLLLVSLEGKSAIIIFISEIFLTNSDLVYDLFELFPKKFIRT